LTIPADHFTCLAVETATEHPGLALLRGGQIYCREAAGLRAPSRAVFEWVRELLEESRTSLAEVDCVAFGAGPGSFTGVRVAVALAQGIAYARGLPLCGVSTLAALAEGALRDSTVDAVACCLDAYMGEVYLGVYERDSEGHARALMPDSLLAPEAVSLPGVRNCLAVGPGWSAHPVMTGRLREQFIRVAPERLPSASDVARLAWPLYRSGQAVAAVAAVPNYLRNQVTASARASQQGRSDV
jgi:tRNA threonylcarbamoyladenosine biosynthesis protein TsaB